MEDTHGGASGVGAANHVEEEFSIGLVIVPIPGRKTEEEIAEDWDEIENQEDVTDICVQFMVDGHLGDLGLSVADHVV